MNRFIILLICFSILFFSNSYGKTIKYAYVRYKAANIRMGPSKRYKKIDKLFKNSKVYILGYKNYYYKIKTDNVEGWIYYRAVTKPVIKNLPDYKVSLKFNKFNNVAIGKIKEFKNYLNFDFYKKNVLITFSYDPEFNSGRIFISTDFNESYYSEQKAPSLKYNQIDLYPFLDFATNFNKFLIKLGSKYSALKEFLETFKLNLILRKDKENFIILGFRKKHKLFFYAPYIYVKKPGFQLIKVPVEDKDLLKKSYIFTLNVPVLYDGTKTVYSVVYDFFEIPY